MFGEHRATAHDPDAGRVAQILYRDRYPVERPAIAARLDLGVGSPRLFSRVPGHDGRIRFQSTVEALDALKLGLHQVCGRQPAVANQRCDLGDRLEMKLVGHRDLP
jgi:hypothetical protein